MRQAKFQMARSFCLLELGFYFIVSHTLKKKKDQQVAVLYTKNLKHKRVKTHTEVTMVRWGVGIKLQFRPWEPNSLLFLITPAEPLGTSRQHPSRQKSWMEPLIPGKPQILKSTNLTF